MPFFSIPLLYSISLVAAVWVSLCIQLSFESPTGSSQSTDALSSFGLKLFDLSSENLLHFYSDKPGYELTHLRNQITLPILNQYKAKTQRQKAVVLKYARLLGTISTPTLTNPHTRMNLADSLQKNELALLPFFFQDKTLRTRIIQTYHSIQNFLNLQTLPDLFKQLVVSNAKSRQFFVTGAFIENKVIMIHLKYGQYFQLAYKPLVPMDVLKTAMENDAQRSKLFCPDYATKEKASLVLNLIDNLHAYMQLHATELIVQALYDSKLESINNSMQKRPKRKNQPIPSDRKEEREEVKRKRNTTHE